MRVITSLVLCFALCGANYARGQTRHTLSSDAMPGVHRVGIAASSPTGLDIAGTMGYGWTEPQSSADGSHHRVSGTLALSGRPLDWLWIAARFDGRYDSHPRDPMGKDSGLVGDPRLSLRAVRKLSRAFTLGGQLTAWFPGKDAPSIAFDATTLDTTVLGTLSFSQFTLSTQLGFRWDNSANAVDNPNLLRQGDRIALGLSDSNAFLFGIAGIYRIRKVELLGEFSWDILVGSDAPSVQQSPMRIALGARYSVTELLQLELLTEVGLSARPPFGPDAPLVPIEPRVQVLAGIRYAFPFHSRTQTQGTRRGRTDTPIETRPTAGTVRGQLVDAAGHPIALAHVELHSGETTLTSETDADGVYRFENVPPGQATITLRAEGFEDATWNASIEPGKEVSQQSHLTPAVVPGQLRGLVRSFRGKGLQASIRVEPTSARSNTDEQGRFQIDLPPGSYEVMIEASGYESQERRVQIEENGVTILNVDLRSRRGH